MAEFLSTVVMPLVWLLCLAYFFNCYMSDHYGHSDDEDQYIDFM